MEDKGAFTHVVARFSPCVNQHSPTNFNTAPLISIGWGSGPLESTDGRHLMLEYCQCPLNRTLHYFKHKNIPLDRCDWWISVWFGWQNESLGVGMHHCQSSNATTGTKQQLHTLNLALPAVMDQAVNTDFVLVGFECCWPIMSLMQTLACIQNVVF